MVTYAEKTFCTNIKNKHNENPKDKICKIVNYIYLGNEYQSFTKSILIENDIKHILCLNTYKKQSSTLEKYKNLGISHYQIIISDTSESDISIYLENIYEYIDNSIKSKNNIFVHCQRGVSRSATAIIYYLMRKMFETGAYKNVNNHEKILDSIITFIKSKRAIVDPNPGFYQVLKDQQEFLIKRYVS